MKTTVKRVFESIQGINARNPYGAVTENDRREAALQADAIMKFIPRDSVAYQIMNGNISMEYTEKQMWSIAYELVKNAAYCAQLEQADREADARRARKSTARQEKKSAAASIAAAKTAADGFAAGDRVSHPRFGEGLVTATDEKTITVTFSEGEKMLMKGFANINRL